MSYRHAAGTSLCSNDGELIHRNQGLQLAIVRKTARLRPTGEKPFRRVPPTPTQSAADDRRRRHVRVVSVHVGVSDWVGKQGEMVARYVDLPFSLYTSANDSLKARSPTLTLRLATSRASAGVTLSPMDVHRMRPSTSGSSPRARSRRTWYRIAKP